MLSHKPCRLVETYDPVGEKNGWLMEIASSTDGWSEFLDNAQVYLTTVLPRKKKGWHVHHKKISQFTCVKGKVIMGIRQGGKIKEMVLDAKQPVTVKVPKEQAICFYNPTNEAAYILNLCSPPYDPNDSGQEDLSLPWEPKV